MRSTFLIRCFVTAAPLALAMPAAAQEAAAPVADQSQADADPGDIVVTATRRSEALSDVPIAISAVSGETLQNTGATDVRALNQVAPSLLVSGATSEVNFTARIRGIGTVGENAGLESSVGLFIDGVYRSRTGVGLSELGDIERVEVLRGPQGTLFGRNSTAGLINIVTKGPELGRFMAKGSATYGNYDFVRLDGAVNVPAGENAAFRLDGVWQQRDGYIKALTPGEPDMNDRDRWLVRGQFAYEPTDALKVRLIGDYSTRDENCCAGVLLGPVRGLTRQADGSALAGPNALFGLVQALGANYPTTTSADRRFEYAMPNTPGTRYTSDSDDWGVSGEISYDFGGASLTSITAYRDYKNKQGQDGDFSALGLLDRFNLDRRFRLFSQELRVQGELFDGRLDWLVGGYFSNEKLDVSDDIKYGKDFERYANCTLFSSVLPTAVLPSNPFCVNVPVVQATIAGLNALPAGDPRRASIGTLSSLIANTARPGFGSLAAVLGQPNIAINGTGNVDTRYRQDSENYAFFTHNTIDIIEDRLMLTLGARYTHEQKNLAADANLNNTLCPLIVNSVYQSLAALPCVTNGTAPDFAAGSPGTRFTDSEWTGTAVLAFKPIDTLLLYGSVSKGYKAGGFNLDFSALDRPCYVAFDTACAARLALPANSSGNGRAEASDLGFASEKVWAYEIGAKWNGPGIDINLAAFYQAYEDYQLNTYNGVNFEVTNIQSCKDDLGGGDRDNSAATGGCAADRLRPGVISKGFEIETFLRPHRDISVNMALTYVDSFYRENLVGTGGRPLSPVLFQLPGGNVSNSSRYAATAGISWTPDIGDSGLTGLVYFDTRLQSDTNTGSDLDPEKIQDGFAVVNGRIGIYGDKRAWGLELWAQNIFAQRYFQIGAEMPLQGSGSIGSVTAPVSAGFSATANQLFVGFPGEPRMYGVTLRGSF
ncbi:TonB-dependent receptor [Sphingomonas radiodurans]|uniref:TonB-dependent receptor n=1 Tax=Sphingomonas radiodurans TaxID=2890321 RepID=UPI001E3ECE6A|nr:TonB-dependent receptor [Sphingomonas radiodurans]WBH17894.1 TonB-dependent receptor [Sphingomonas radiodurans]